MRHGVRAHLLGYPSPVPRVSRHQILSAWENGSMKRFYDRSIRSIAHRVIYSPNERWDAIVSLESLWRSSRTRMIRFSPESIRLLIAWLIFIGSFFGVRVRVFWSFGRESRKWNSCQQVRYVINENFFTKIMVAYAGVIVVSSY